MTGTDWSRRRFLRTVGGGGAAAVALGAAGYGGYLLPHGGDTAAAQPASPAADTVEHYRSRPDLHPPQLTVTHRGTGRHRLPPRPRYLFTAPKGYASPPGPGQQGPMISDLHGNPVWFLPTPGPDSVPMNFRTQTYQGKPVLTWWQGTAPAGHGEGVCLIHDTGYRRIATVRAVGAGLHADLHEFLLTPRGTALITVYRKARADTSPMGGPKDGWVLSGMVQEIDVASGKLLFQWDSLDHVAVSESHKGMSGTGSADDPMDYFHINSVDVAPDGDLVISARNTWALYKVHRPTGRVVWRLGGTRSDFRLDQDARFYWQHDARVHGGGNRISIFDDGSSPPKEKESRGLVLAVDEKARRVRVDRQYLHPAALLADNQGNLQLLPDGRVLVCWGAEPYTSEFDRNGKVIFDARFPAGDQTYRSFTADWTGTPTDEPAVAVGVNQARGATVYVSWNGATEVHRWRILAGPQESSQQPAAEATRGGFETAIAVASPGPYYTAVALDAHGRELGRSAAVRRAA